MSIINEANEVDIKSYYNVIPNSDGNVKIIDGPFEGLIYKYGEFKLVAPKSEDEQPAMKYDFDIIHMPPDLKNMSFPDEMKNTFDQLLVSILVDMVQDNIAEEVRIDYDNTNGEGDIDESFERRVFYKIDSSVP